MTILLGSVTNKESLDIVSPCLSLSGLAHDSKSAIVTYHYGTLHCAWPDTHLVGFFFYIKQYKVRKADNLKGVTHKEYSAFLTLRQP